MSDKRQWKAHQGWADEDLNTGMKEKYPHWCEVTGARSPDGNPSSINGHFGIENARLIAAAPELLDALQKMVRLYSGQTDNTGGYPDAMFDSANSAIAKATTPQ